MAKGMQAQKYKTPLLWSAAVRAVLGLAAIPLAPFLYREHFAALVLLRPTKEVLLAAGFEVRRGDANALTVVLAAVPLAVFGVWLFFFLGQAFAKELQEGKGLPRFADRLLPTEKIKDLCAVLEDKGPKVIFLGRLATFPSSLVGTAAGTSKMETPRFLTSDGAGALVSLVEVIGAGFLLGQAYKSAGPWLTAVGVVALLGMLFVLGRSLTRDQQSLTKEKSG
jgi:membrane protein DedA with SNARE-associated domain